MSFVKKISLQVPISTSAVFLNGFLSNERELCHLAGLANSVLIEETLLYCYYKYGTDFIKKLKGNYSLAILDSKNQKIILVRDKLGTVPLYYYINNEINNQYITFSQDIPSIVRENGLCTSIDLLALTQYLTMHSINCEHTLFSGVKRLLPGHYLSFDLRLAKVQLTQFWDINFSPQPWRVGEVVEQFSTHFQRSVSGHQEGAAATLSSGRDSASIVLTMKHIFKQDIPTFSAIFDIKNYEKEHIAYIVRKHKLRHKFKEITYYEYLSHMHMVVKILGGPPIDSCEVCSFITGRCQSNFINKILTGNFADEFWGGFGSYRFFYLLQILKQDPLKIFSFRHLMSKQLFRFLYLAYAKCKYQDKNLGLYIKFSPQRLKILRMPYDAQVTEKEIWGNFNQIINHPTLSPLDKVFYAFIKRAEVFGTHDFLLAQANNIRAIFPYADDDLIDLALKVPREILFHQGNIKYPQLQYLAQWMPISYLRLPKRGFPIPIFDWFKSDQFKYLEYFWQQPATPLFRELFDIDYIKRLVFILKQMRFDFLGSFELATKMHTLQMLKIFFQEFESHLRL
ncbi:MAG: hypothetical protein HQK51_12775 [Oligoflexia bacterium]|nr:hypothetical protein [Oligoflexia bacterium]